MVLNTSEYSCGAALEEFSKLTEAPEAFLTLTGDDYLAEKVKASLKHLYDFAKGEEQRKTKSNALPELIVDGFDLEQIWQQIELQNEEVLDRSILDVSRILTCKNLFFKEEYVKEGNSVEDLEESDEEQENVSKQSVSEDEIDKDRSDVSDEESENETAPPKRNKKKSIVDDDFFKLDEMEEFLNKEEAEESKLTKNKQNYESSSESESEGSIDLFKPDLDEEDEENENLKNPRYKDFFVKQDVPNDRRSKRKRLSEEEDDSEAEPPELKSSLELREERLKRKIEDLEEQALSEKPWQLKGEITADKRPQNSLLEEIVDFDITSRPAPVITEQTTLQLEDIIKQRIRDKVFDSVVRKEKPVETPLEFKKMLVLDQEKSKESLAQIYEKEYLKQREALDPNAADKDEPEPEQHIEIRNLMDSLFTKLDALSNFHYTPKPVAPELKIITNVPAISMEEVAPVATSDAALLAPEEVRRKPKGDPIGKTERTETDKNRERRKKKLKQKIHAEAKKKKEMQGLGNKYTKLKMKKAIEKAVKDKNVEKLEDSGGKFVKSSTAFFSQLQEEVQSQIKSKVQEKKKGKQKLDAKKLKL